PGVGKVVPQRVNRLEREIAPVDLDNNAGLGGVDDQLAVFHVITQRRHAAHPHAFFRGRGDLVADAFACDFPLELGEGQKEFSVSRPMLVVVLNCCVIDTNETPRRSKTSTSLAKSESARVNRSTLWTTTTSIWPASMSAISRFRAGRSIVPPETPPSS